MNSQTRTPDITTTAETLRARQSGEEERSAAAALMGRARTPRKAAAAAQNGRLHGGREPGFETPTEVRDKQSAAARAVWAARKARGETVANGRAPLPLNQITCTCGRGDTPEGHPTTCPRGRAIRRRQKAGTL